MSDFKGPGFLVWDPSQEDEAHALRVVAASDAEEAAELYAERDNNNGNYDGGEYELKVRCSDGTLVDVAVAVDWDPIFTARVKS